MKMDQSWICVLWMEVKVRTNFVDFFTGAISNTSGLARIVVTGGGGNGALIFGEVDTTSSI